MGLHDRFEIGILGFKISDYVTVANDGIILVSQPVVWIFERYAMVSEAVRPPFGDRGVFVRQDLNLRPGGLEFGSDVMSSRAARALALRQYYVESRLTRCRSTWRDFEAKCEYLPNLVRRRIHRTNRVLVFRVFPRT